MLRAPYSYHGASPLWREGSDEALAVEGVEPSASASLRPYAFNDLRSVVAAADASAEHGGIAAIIVAAFKWDWGVKHEAATAEFLRGVRRLCDERGAALVCDDVRSSFRVNAGGTWEDERYGHGVRPDLSCLSKGIANGQPLSAVVGSRKWRKGPSIYDFRNEGGGGFSPKADVVREVAWILYCKSVPNVDKGV